MTKKETWKPVTIGGITGILMGAGAMYAIQKSAADASDSSDLSDPLKVANPADGLSFRQAFDAAREEVGPGGVFRWHGNIYNTYTAEEWKAMSDQEHELFAQRVQPEVSPADIDTRQVAAEEPASSETDDVQIAENQDDTPREDGESEDNQSVYAHNSQQASTNSQQTANDSNDDDVRVVGFGHVEVSEGRYVAVEEVDINGQRVAIIDVDNDGVADIAMSDLNQNGHPDDGEIIDLHTGEALTFTNEGNDSNDIQGELTQDDSQPLDEGADMMVFNI